ncbi:DUF308 domain-containing protein [Micromonospora soli]|uniref:HdeD family acid-resistance protein n=1 Tax=Micromonospora sp. NBRC 110009 TaxID=3061627 RepID=UPI0026729399|nr:DUF308 domain-containing protein [Micromonospora sp. NBRC 110009]WKT98481.1 DUF308 domain-containing protein [Micromonospora sp. NBRC 110009]
MRDAVWALALRGVAAIVFGVVALVWPSVTALALALLFGAYALVYGAVQLAAGFGRGQSGRARTPLILSGLLGGAIALVTLLWPTITALALAVLIGIWAIVIGVIEIWAGTRVRGWGLLAGVGILSVLAGVLIIVRPDAGAVAIARVIGAYAVVAGILMVVVAWRLRRSPLYQARPAG